MVKTMPHPANALEQTLFERASMSIVSASCKSCLKRLGAWASHPRLSPAPPSSLPARTALPSPPSLPERTARRGSFIASNVATCASGSFIAAVAACASGSYIAIFAACARGFFIAAACTCAISITAVAARAHSSFTTTVAAATARLHLRARPRWQRDPGVHFAHPLRRCTYVDAAAAQRHHHAHVRCSRCPSRCTTDAAVSS